MILHRRKYRMGDLVQRFGDFTKGEPSLVLDNPRWHKFGNPEEVEISFRRSTGSKLRLALPTFEEDARVQLYKSLDILEKNAADLNLPEVARLLNEARYLIAEDDD